MLDPFGMRWFGVFAAAVVLIALTELLWMQVPWLAMLVYWPATLALVGLLILLVGYFSHTAQHWLLGHWR